MTCSCFKNKFSSTVSFLEYYGVTSGIKCAFKSLNWHARSLLVRNAPVVGKAKQNRFGTVNLKMWKILIGGQFIYYLGNVH